MCVPTFLHYFMSGVGGLEARLSTKSLVPTDDEMRDVQCCEPNKKSLARLIVLHSQRFRMIPTKKSETRAYAPTYLLPTVS
jgi:hypothetical protein